MFELGPDDVHLWIAHPAHETHQARRDLYASWLSADERDRESRLKFEQDRHRFRVTRAMVRRVLGAYLGIDPAACEFRAEEHGRPVLVNDTGPAPLTFNLSHADDLILLGVTRARAIGVDVERLRGKKNAAQLAERFFAPFERERVVAEPDASREDLFVRYWTLKEAYIKARGIGLSLPLEKFGFTLAGASPALHIEPELADDPARWAVLQWRPTPSHWAAICVDRPVLMPSPPPVRDFATLHSPQAAA